MATDWAETATADNADAVATRAAVSGRAHMMTAVVASYEANKAGFLTVTSGGRTLLEVEVFDEFDFALYHPLRGDEGASMIATLSPSGTGGTDGYVTIMGYTV